jgi:hypothetical protein
MCGTLVVCVGKRILQAHSMCASQVYDYRDTSYRHIRTTTVCDMRVLTLCATLLLHHVIAVSPELANQNGMTPAHLASSPEKLAALAAAGARLHCVDALSRECSLQQHCSTAYSSCVCHVPV